MKPEYQQQLTELAEELVSPERFGKIALAELDLIDQRHSAMPPTVQVEYIDLPETRQAYQLPPFRNGRAWGGA